MTDINNINFQKNTNFIGNQNSVHRSGGIGQILYGLFSDKNKGVNGEIDEAVFQGSTGDCWLLSGVLSLSYTQEGKQAIKEAIKQDENGNYQVTFKGIDKTYTVSQEELKNKNVSTIFGGLGKKSEYSTGDDDMLLLELAVEKAKSDKDIELPTENGLNGSSAYYLYQLFSGTTDYAHNEKESDVKDLLDYYQENKENASATLGVINGFSSLEGNHAYAVKDYDGEKITLVNPWNSSRDTTLSNKALMDNLGKYDISVIDYDS